MRVQAYGNIQPAAKFGVPAGDDTVVFPGGDVHGDPVLSVPMVKAGWGTMPRFREDDEAVKLCLRVETVTIELKDNYFIASGDFSDFREAQRLISDRLQLFVTSLTVADSTLYTFEIDTYQVDGSDYYRPPTPVRWRFVGYNTMQLVERICLAAQLLEVNDERLERAIFYFNLSLATYKAAQETTGTNWDWFTGLVSSALLNLYKAATSILGDPSVRADKHQRRIKELRLSSEDIDDFKNLKSFRDSFDVAHYTLNEKESQEIHSVFEKYKAYTSQLIMKYSKNV